MQINELIYALNKIIINNNYKADNILNVKKIGTLEIVTLENYSNLDFYSNKTIYQFLSRKKFVIFLYFNKVKSKYFKNGKPIIEKIIIHYGHKKMEIN